MSITEAENFPGKIKQKDSVKSMDSKTGGILIVEDEALVAQDLMQELEFLGHSVCGVASNGRDALRIAEEMYPDLVLMDIRIKGNLDGIEVAKAMQNRFSLSVVYITAYADDPTVERAKETSPLGYLTKPYSRRDLKTVIEMALSSKRRLPQKQREAWFSNMLRSIADGIIATDIEGNIQFMNVSAELLTGWELGHAYGKQAGVVVRLKAAETPFFAHSIFEVLNRKDLFGWIRNATLIAEDGEEVPIEFVASPIRGTDESIIGVIFSIRDVSKRIQ